jgi:hypothetical protein
VEDIYNVAHDEIVRALSQQAAALEALRTRAGLLLSAASIATSFLGGQALQGRPLDVLRWTAVGAFVGLAVSVLYVLWPHRERLPVAMPSRLLREFDTGSSHTEAITSAALYLEASYVENEDLVKRLSDGLRIAMGLLALEVAAWIAALAGS